MTRETQAANASTKRCGSAIVCATLVTAALTACGGGSDEELTADSLAVTPDEVVRLLADDGQTFAADEVDAYAATASTADDAVLEPSLGGGSAGSLAADGDLKRAAAAGCSLGGTTVRYGSDGAVVYRPARPRDAMVLYARGTNQVNTDCNVVAAVQSLLNVGLTVVVPNYRPRSYLVRDVQADDALGALNAAKAMFFAGRKPKLFLTGFSQGGYVTLATHRALIVGSLASARAARNNFDFRASFPAAGPYDVFYTQKYGARVASIDAKIRESYDYQLARTGGFTDDNMKRNAVAGRDIGSTWFTYGAMRLCYATGDRTVPTVNTTEAARRLAPSGTVPVESVSGDHGAAQRPCAQRAANWFGTQL